MKILFFGATGFVGRYVAAQLALSHDVIVPTRNIEEGKKAIKNSEKIRFIQFEEDKVEQTVWGEKPDVVINVIGIISEKPAKGVTFERVQYLFPKAMIKGAKEAGVKKFIQISALGAEQDSRSDYHSTKARTEEYLRESGLNYVIFKPSFIMGKEQMLLDNLQQYGRFAPFLPAPKTKLQPLHVLDVRDCFVKAVEDENLTKNTFDLCGSEVISFKEFFEIALDYLNISRPVVEVPVKVFKVAVPFAMLFPDSPLTYDQYYLLEKDNVCQGTNHAAELLPKLRNARVVEQE